jgi:hypothetical protein
MKGKLWWIIGALLIVAALTLSACGGEPEDTPAPVEPTTAETGTGEETNGDTETTDDGEDAPPAATLTPAEQIPDTLPVHPEAFDFEITEASQNYVYWIPMMVAEATEYIQEELAALGWEAMGQPTVMGHIATLNMEREEQRVAVSMQDNERKQATRVQMQIIEK